MKINFASYRLAFILIAILILHIILASIIPQKDFDHNQIVNIKQVLGDYYFIIDKLALDRIYYAPPFFILLGLLAINIIVGNIRRFKSIYKIERTLIKTQYLGSIIFHFSLIIILSGVILNYLNKYQGVFGLTEGQSEDDRQTSYFRIFKGPLYEPIYNKFQITLDELDTEHKVKNATTNAARVSIQPTDNSNTIQDYIYTNKPLNWKNFKFHYGANTGYSPEIIIFDNEGKTVFSAFIRLAVQKTEDSIIHSDFIHIPDIDYRIDLRVNLDSTKIDDSTTLQLSVKTHENSIFSGDLMIKDTIEFDEYRLTFSELRRWCYVSVVESPFLNLIFFGFWSALGGMLIGLIPRVIKDNIDK